MCKYKLLFIHRSNKSIGKITHSMQKIIGRLCDSLFLREDTYKKKVFFSGRTTKGVGRVNPPDHLAKNHYFFL